MTGLALRRARSIVLVVVSGGLLVGGASAGQRATPILIGALTESWGPTPGIVGLRDGLIELGYRENEHFMIGVRFTQGEFAELPAAVRQLVERGADLLVGGENAALAARMVTDRIPIVFLGASDPVGLGLVQSFARPGGNVTGVADFRLELAALPGDIGQLPGRQFPGALGLGDAERRGRLGLRAAAALGDLRTADRFLLLLLHRARLQRARYG